MHVFESFNNRMAAAEFLSTGRGRYLVLDGFLYVTNRKLDRKTFWRCKDRKCCKATVIATTDTVTVLDRTNAVHDHDSHDKEIDVHKKVNKGHECVCFQLL